MEYKCLRNCYVDDRFFYGGDVYDLPDEMFKDAKNFQPIEEKPPLYVSDKDKAKNPKKT